MRAFSLCRVQSGALETMKICIAVNFLQELTGSELLAIELANECIRSGHSVDILAHSLDKDFAKRQLDSRVNCYSDLDAYSYDDADIYYFQHQMGSVIIPSLIDCFDQVPNFTWPYLVFSHFSINFGFETPGPFAEFLFADDIWCNSEETKAHLIENYGKKFKDARVFYNAAPFKYSTVSPVSGPKKLTNLLAVSNHFPEPVIQALEILESKGVKVVRRGKAFEQKKITPKDLEQNEAVLTIGKTVQYALRAERAVYCYDIHGGPGWLNGGNFEASSFHNFSGRNHPRSLDAVEIADELIDGYADSIKFSKRLTGVQLEKFKLEAFVKKMLSRAETQLYSSKRNERVKKHTQNPQLRGNLKQEHEIAISLMLYARSSRIMRRNLDQLGRQKAKLKMQRDRLITQRDTLKTRVNRLTTKLNDLNAKEKV